MKKLSQYNVFADLILKKVVVFKVSVFSLLKMEGSLEQTKTIFLPQLISALKKDFICVQQYLSNSQTCPDYCFDKYDRGDKLNIIIS